MSLCPSVYLAVLLFPSPVEGRKGWGMQGRQAAKLGHWSFIHITRPFMRFANRSAFEAFSTSHNFFQKSSLPAYYRISSQSQNCGRISFLYVSLTEKIRQLNETSRMNKFPCHTSVFSIVVQITTAHSPSNFNIDLITIYAIEINSKSTDLLGRRKVYMII